ncbi:MAG: hypothetical protein KDD55_13455, partial [Bdellovibrionales bacterium]|nr:hypothetical protein [Bdellovibrionales bacterium]
MIQFRWMYTIEQIDELRHEWPRLLSHSPTRTVFQSIEWHLAWLQSFKHEYSPAFLTAWNGDSLVALAPLVSSTSKILRIPITTYSFAGSANYASDYADFLYHDLSSLSSLLSFLMSAPPWQNLLLRNLPSSSPTKQVLLNHFTPWNHQWWDASRAIDTPTRIMHNDRQDQDILAKTLFKRKRK